MPHLTSCKSITAMMSLALVSAFSTAAHAQILGLNNTVIHLQGPSQTGDGVVAYNDYPLASAPLNDTGLSQVATFVAGTTDGSHTFGSAADTTTEVNYLRYTYVDKADTFAFLTGSNSTTSYLGADAAGVGLNGADVQAGNVAGTDLSSASSGFIDNATGFIYVTTPGSLTFTLTEADDQARVQVDGTTVVETNYNTGVKSVSETLTAGYHSFDLLNYQNGGGQNLLFTLTPTVGEGVTPAVFEFTATQAVPEPTTWAMMLGGLGLLALVRSRFRRA